MMSFDSRLPHPSKRKARSPGAPIAPLTHDDGLWRDVFASRGFEVYANRSESSEVRANLG